MSKKFSFDMALDSIDNLEVNKIRFPSINFAGLSNALYFENRPSAVVPVMEVGLLNSSPSVSSVMGNTPVRRRLTYSLIKHSASSETVLMYFRKKDGSARWW